MERLENTGEERSIKGSEHQTQKRKPGKNTSLIIKITATIKESPVLFNSITLSNVS